MKHITFLSTLVLWLSACATVIQPTETVTPKQLPTAIPTDVPPSPILTRTPTPMPLIYADDDRDGLSNQKELLVGTDPNNFDTDGDMLSDYEEVTKYFLNPLANDTDGDGILDNDVNERRENGHTIKAVIKIRQPFDVEEMGDHFQDVTVISETPNSLTFEVVFYVDSYHIIEELPWDYAPDWYSDLGIYLRPDPLMNFDEEMSVKTRQLFASRQGISDLDIIRNMYAWTRRNVQAMPNAPEPFLDILVTDDDQILFSTPPNFNSQNYTEWDMTHLVLGKESFYNRTHGSCGSTANFHSTILRSIGIPTRIIQTIPLLDMNNSYQRNLLANLSNSTRNKVIGQEAYNHFLVEAFIGNRWVRINNSEFENQVEPIGAFIKIIAFSSWKEVDFAHPWGRPGRPYELIEVEEQEAIHQPLRYNFSN